MNTVLNIFLLISFYFLAVTLHLVWCDDVPSAEADMVITQSEPQHYSTPDDFDF